MSETAAMIHTLSQAAELLNKVTGAEPQVKALLAKISELTNKVMG